MNQKEYDVIVCGGGVAGIAAALAAARQGARPLLLEKEYALGGLATLGLIVIYLPLDDGEGERTVASGIAKWYQPEDLIGRSIVLVANLKPAVLCGVESQGMILAADAGEDDVRVIFVDGIPAGSKIH